MIESVEDEELDDGAARRYASPKMGLICESKWQQLSLDERHEISVAINHLIQGDIDRALETGTFDARTGRTLVRMAPEREWDRG